MQQESLKLKHPTAFADFNKKMGKEATYLTSELSLFPLKYKHLREMAKIKPDEQMNYAISALTNLSENDLGELTPEDAAELMKKVYDSMKEFTTLAKVFWDSSLDKQMLDKIGV